VLGIVYFAKQEMKVLENRQKTKANPGFTLVEILVVVVILGILASVVIIKLAQASTETKGARLHQELQTMRSQIEVYKVHHNDNVPGAGTATFAQAMTSQTDINGAVGTDYGPYIERIPTNPFNGLDTVDVSGTGTLGDESHGWDFNLTTDAFQADDSGTCADGTAHSAL
jgi:prepilin-type N-terminal cleavage/methylation domain-containing protein